MGLASIAAHLIRQRHPVDWAITIPNLQNSSNRGDFELGS
jgi:hypothetical protein